MEACAGHAHLCMFKHTRTLLLVALLLAGAAFAAAPTALADPVDMPKDGHDPVPGFEPIICFGIHPGQMPPVEVYDCET